MSDSPHMNTSDWLGLGGLAATIVGSVVGGVKGMLGKRDERITALETGHHDQATQLAVLRTCQENTKVHLEQIRETTRDTNEKLDMVLASLANRQLGGKRRTDE